MNTKPNILFIMADQLRYDFLGCVGHPHIKTPNIDALARKGIRFTNTFCQSPVCGPSRMSFYTGRYPSSHGATYNPAPLRVSELTLGDYLRPEGYRVALTGKSHMVADVQGMARVGLDPGTTEGRRIAECGFDPYWRDDGLHPCQSVDPDLEYNNYLRDLGYQGKNPWHDYANSAEGENGEILSGWKMRYARLPARVKEEHSETAYTTNRAIDFMEEYKGEPWCLHVSYIKPHWPYVAPAPYHKMYDQSHVLPANKHERELENPQPVIEGWMKHEECINFSKEEVRQRVIPTYMGLITQLDDYIGRLVTYLEKTGQSDNTIIVFTSDHGDYLGDHWLGEKDMFHEESVKIPLIVMDPRPAANATRGFVNDKFVEAIDLVPTFLDWAGGDVKGADHILEGRSITGLVNGENPEQWRKVVISEYDYAWRHARWHVGVDVDVARIYMLRTAKWKLVYFEGFRPQLFDLENDPKELTDLGANPDYTETIKMLEAALFEWSRNRRMRTAIPNESVRAATGGAQKRGYFFGVW